MSIAMLWAASVVHAQGEVTNLRMSKQPEYDRIVLDLGVEEVDAKQSMTDDEFVLELSASKPGDLPLATEDKLADMRIYFETSANGSRIVVDRAGRSVRVFRLEGDPAAGKGDRLVLDVGKTGGAALKIPPDATPVPDSRVARAAPPTPGRPRTPTPEPPRQPEPEEDPLAELDEPIRPDGRETNLRTPPKENRPAPDVAESAPEGEDVWVLVRAIEIEGVKESPSLAELRDLKLPVSPVAGGYVAPRGDQPVQRIPLGQLTGDDSSGRKLSGSVLQLIVETIAAAYARNDKLGTKVDIRRADLDNLFSPDSDGRLVIRVREASERSASSR